MRCPVWWPLRKRHSPSIKLDRTPGAASAPGTACDLIPGGASARNVITASRCTEEQADPKDTLVSTPAINSTELVVGDESISTVTDLVRLEPLDQNSDSKGAPANLPSANAIEPVVGEELDISEPTDSIAISLQPGHITNSSCAPHAEPVAAGSQPLDDLNDDAETRDSRNRVDLKQSAQMHGDNTGERHWYTDAGQGDLPPVTPPCVDNHKQVSGLDA